MVEVTDKQIKDIAIENLTILFRYALAVGEKIGTKEAFKILAGIFNKYHIEWAKRNMPKLDIKGKDCIAAEKLVDAYFKDTHMFTFGQMMPFESDYSSEMKYIEKNPKKIVVHNKQWCPIIEVTENLGLEAGYLCKNYIFPEWEKVINTIINPNIKIKVGKTRPKSKFCEEIYELTDN